MADEIKAAFKVRSVAKSKFTRAETILNEALGATDIPVATLQRRFDDLKKCWTAVQAAHDEYIFSVEQKPEDVTQPADHLLEPYIDELVMRFNQIEVKADRHLEDILNSLDDKATKQSTGAPIKQTNQSLSQDVRLSSPLLFYYFLLFFQILLFFIIFPKNPDFLLFFIIFGNFLYFFLLFFINLCLF